MTRDGVQDSTQYSCTQSVMHACGLYCLQLVMTQSRVVMTQSDSSSSVFVQSCAGGSQLYNIKVSSN